MSKSRIVHRCGAARRMRMDGKAPRSSSDAGAHFHWVFGLGSLVFVKDPNPKTQDPKSVRSRGWLVFFGGDGALRVRELHRQHRRFVVERFWTTARVLNQHHQVVLIFSKPPNTASLIHNHKEQDLAFSRSHLSD
jgi:hypothetical protein